MKEAIAQIFKAQETSNISINVLSQAHSRIEATVTDVTNVPAQVRKAERYL